MAEFLEILLGLTGETHHHGGTQSDVRHHSADALNQGGEALAVAGAVHPPQHVAGGVLEGDVHIVEHLFLSRHHGQQRVGDVLRVTIEQTNPLEIVNFTQFGEQLRQAALAVQIAAVDGGILRHQHDLLNPRGHQGASLGHNILHGATAQVAADVGDGAVGAPVVATVRDTQIGKEMGGGEHAGAIQTPAVTGGEGTNRLTRHHLLHHGGDVVVGTQAQHSVTFGNLIRQLLLIALRQTAGDDDLLNLLFLLQLGELQNILDGLLLGIGDKAAGVDNHHVSIAAVGGNLVARLLQLSQHQFGVHLIFGASQGYHTHFDCHSLLLVVGGTHLIHSAADGPVTESATSQRGDDAAAAVGVVQLIIILSFQ